MARKPSNKNTALDDIAKTLVDLMNRHPNVERVRITRGTIDHFMINGETINSEFSRLEPKNNEPDGGTD